jgi:hypothetical protein
VQPDDTLIVDGDGVYDLGLFNDRLLLGLKGTMSEAELHVLAGRLQGARRAAAARGELRFPLPVGYVYDDDGAIVMDLDEEVRAAVADVFACFEQTGSAYAVVGAFADRRFPARAYGGAWAGQLRYGRLTHSRTLTVLRNPAYAGAYVFGRRRSRRHVDPDGTIRATTTMLPREQWGVVIHDHHPGYISWEQFLRNEQRLAANRTHDGARPAREGSALLQGIVRCGGCGRSMSTFYTSDGKPGYDCGYSRADRAATPGCRGVMGEVVERAVAERLLAAVAPDQIALALTAADTVADRRGRATRAVELRVERAATTPRAPSAPSISATPTTGSSLAPSSRAGRPSCASSPTPKPSSPATPSSPHRPRAPTSRRWPATCRACGPRPPPRTVIASGCCAR